MSLKGKYVEKGDLCWLQLESVDYTYLNAYAKNRSEKVEDGKSYVKVRITKIVWKYINFVFNINIVNKDGTECYPQQVYEYNRLTQITD